MFALNQNFLKRIFLFVAILGVGFSSYSQISQRPQDSCPSGQQQIGKLDSSTAICAGNSKIQVGAFGDFNNAKNFVNKMRSQGFDSALDPGIEGQLNKILISVNGKTGFSDDSAKTIGSRLAQAGIKYSVVIDRGSNNSSSGGGQRLQEANSQNTQRPQESLLPMRGFVEVLEAAQAVVERNPNAGNYLVQAGVPTEIASCSAVGVYAAAMFSRDSTGFPDNLIKQHAMNLAVMTLAYTRLKNQNPGLSAIFERDVRVLNQDPNYVQRLWPQCDRMLVQLLNLNSAVWANFFRRPFLPR
jgi:hypothetical protein